MTPALMCYLRVPSDLTESLRQRYLSLLALDEQLKIERQCTQRNRNVQLTTRAFLRTILSDQTGVHPAEWRFSVNSYGKPEIETPAEFRRLRFNLSHSKNIIACLFARDREVGVDIEHISVPRRMLDIVDHHFGLSEAMAIRALPRDQQHLGFLEVWTLKESYLKALGTGLSKPLNHCEFTIHGREPYQICARVQFPDRVDRWQFALARLQDEYLLATTIEIRDRTPVMVDLRDATLLLPQ